MSTPEAAALDQHPAVRVHVMICMASLTAMVVALVLRRQDVWVLLPAFLGALALIFRWRAGPVIVLLAVVLLLGSWWLGTNPGWLVASGGFWVWRLFYYDWGHFRLPPLKAPSRDALPLYDLLLAASLLTYAAGHYRLQGLVGRLFPPDPRRGRAAARGGKAEAKKFQESLRRPADLATARETVVLLAALAACVGLSQLAWAWLRGRETELELADSAWRGVVVLWLLGGGALAAAGLLRYLALRRMSPAEATMYLQDLLWREARREQRRLNRWLAWAWLRRRRREEREQS